VLIGNSHGIKITVNVPLKTTDQYFTLYKIIVLPSRISGYNFVRYCWLLLRWTKHQLSRHLDYRGIFETMYNRTCPADIVIYNTHIKSCEFILLFQANVSNTMCRRDILYNFEHLSYNSMGKSGSTIYPSGVQALYAARRTTVWAPTRRHIQRITLLYHHQWNPDFTRTPRRNTEEHRQFPILRIWSTLHCCRSRDSLKERNITRSRTPQRSPELR